MRVGDTQTPEQVIIDSVSFHPFSHLFPSWNEAGRWRKWLFLITAHRTDSRLCLTPNTVGNGKYVSNLLLTFLYSGVIRFWTPFLLNGEQRALTKSSFSQNPCSCWRCWSFIWTLKVSGVGDSLFFHAELLAGYQYLSFSGETAQKDREDYDFPTKYCSVNMIS